MAAINADWHRLHPMAKNPTPEQRIVWHVDHVQNCECRGIPAGVLALMKGRGVPLPEGYDQTRK